MTSTKYSTIILLSAGITQTEAGNRTFSEGHTSFKYLIQGDPHEFGFKAIQKLYQDGSCTNFVLVGGLVEVISPDGTKSPYLDASGNPVPKALVMENCLIENYHIPKEALTILQSASNTQGNAETVAKYFSNQHPSGAVGLMSLFYHLTRALRMFASVFPLPVLPICAESVVYESEFENIKQFYTTEGFNYILGATPSQDSQIKGMSDLEFGTYSPRFK